MRKCKWVWVFMLVLVAVPIFLAPQTSEAQWRHRYYRPWGYPYGYPYGWEYPYSYPYPYYNPPVIVVPPEQPAQPQPYMQQQPQQPTQQYWYFCRNPEGYYPYIRECPGGFLQVVPQTVPPPSAPGAQR